MLRCLATIFLAVFAPLVLLGALGGCRKAEPHARIATSNSYLAAAVHDVLGPDEAVYRLAGPEMCPGHFALRPSQVADMRTCRLFLRFDFQKQFDEKLRPLTDAALTIEEVPLASGLCVPDSYLATCRTTADALVAAKLIDRPAADAALAKIRQRIGALAAWARQAVRDAGLADRPVVASGHQASFCRWLGLRVVASYSGPDAIRPADIETLVHNAAGKVHLVIANIPEGTALADVLADRLNAKVVMFGNFPAHDGPQGFDEMFRSNVEKLLQAGGA